MTQTARPAGRRHAATISVRRWWLATSLMLLNLFDVLTTKIVLSLGGTEQNPAMVRVMDHPTAPWITKLVICLAVATLLFASPRESRRAEWGVGAVVAFYVAVVGWNLSLIVRYFLT